MLREGREGGREGGKGGCKRDWSWKIYIRGWHPGHEQRAGGKQAGWKGKGEGAGQRRPRAPQNERRVCCSNHFPPPSPLPYIPVRLAVVAGGRTVHGMGHA